MNNFLIMKCLVGSKLHHLDTFSSDIDTKSVFLWLTSEILKIGPEPKIKQTIREDSDNLSMEIGHFLKLGLSSNPTILEVFRAPILETDNKQLADELQALFPYVWSSKGVFTAYTGFSHSQHSRMFKESEVIGERPKLGCTQIRVLLQGIELLKTNTFSPVVKDSYKELDLFLPESASQKLLHLNKSDNFTSWRDYLFAAKTGQVEVGNIIDTAEYLKKELNKAYEGNPNKENNVEVVNEFLLRVRKEHWE